MPKYTFDALRYCQRNMGRYQMASGKDPMEMIAAELEAARELREAVAWERECEEYRIWIIRHQLFPKKRRGFWEALDIFAAARAEVDRLLNNGGE